MVLCKRRKNERERAKEKKRGQQESKEDEIEKRTRSNCLEEELTRKLLQ